jgi:hypothetical protein
MNETGIYMNPDRNFFTVYRLAATIVTLLGLCAVPVISHAQDADDDLNLDDVRIEGRDTRVYGVAGGMITTIALEDELLSIPDEDRSILASQGIIGNDQRIIRPQVFTVAHGGYARGEMISGAMTPYNMRLKGSLDNDGTAFTYAAAARSSERNTPELSIPEAREFSLTGYMPLAGFRASAGLSYSGGGDPDDSFRGRDRTRSDIGGVVTLHDDHNDAWDLSGIARFHRGSYQDGDIALDESDMLIDSALSLSGELYDVSVTADGEFDYVSFGDDMGSLFQAGVDGSLLLLDGLGCTIGGRFYTFALPDKSTKVRIYPDITFDWALGPRMFFRAGYTPGIQRRTFGDIHDMNGLAMPVAMLFEDTNIALDAEIGIRMGRSEVSLVGFHRSTDGALVFSRSGAHYAVMPDAELEETGFGVEARLRRFSRLDLDGSITVTDATWNGAGEVPYVPEIAGDADAVFHLTDGWRITGRMRFRAEQYVEAGLNDTADGFLMLDIGIERTLLAYLDLAVELRNMTNAEGYWWSAPYEVPGAGLFAAIRGRY